MLETTIAGSLPKPGWLAEPGLLWAPWRVRGDALVEAKRAVTFAQPAGAWMVSRRAKSRALRTRC